MADASGFHPARGCSRLLMAARCGHLDYLKRMVKELQYLGVSINLKNVKDKDGCTVFHHAAKGGNIDVCKYLLDELKVDHINLRDGIIGETPLHHAIIAGHPTTAAYLLGKGANPNAATNAGDTPLHYAVMKGYEELIHLLISKGAEVDAKSESMTPLIWAASLCNAKAMKILLDNNANPNMIHLPVRSPLAESILSGSSECVKLLLKAGADPDMLSWGMTPLHLAVFEGADIEIIKCLLDGKANPDTVNCRGVKPVEIAALKGYYEAGMILFPVTTPFPSISGESQRQWANNKLELFRQLKSKGEEEFKRNDYTNAVYWYFECYIIGLFDATILSNLSCCYAHLNDGKNALRLAQECVALRPDWPKAHYREGVAWNLQKRFDQAAASFKCGLELDPENHEIRDAYGEALLRLHEQ